MRRLLVFIFAFLSSCMTAQASVPQGVHCHASPVAADALLAAHCGTVTAPVPPAACSCCHDRYAAVPATAAALPADGSPPAQGTSFMPAESLPGRLFRPPAASP